MPISVILLPALAEWAQQLANILPLAALVEFIDVAAKLHVAELSNSVSLWNWPVTPSGARLLLSDEDTEQACCLDRPERSPTLHCFDGRYGDHYPCSTPTTTRLCVLTKGADLAVANRWPNLKDPKCRRQKLQVVHVSPIETDRPAKPGRARRAVFSVFGSRSLRYGVVTALGWVLWMALTAISLLAGLQLAFVYLFLMPLTGLTIRGTHGGSSRQLLDPADSHFTRLVVASNSLNSSEWWGFVGATPVVNSLLNRPLYRRRVSSATVRRLLKALLTTLIVCQWALAIGACAMQGWDAFAISLWIGLCALVSTYAYPPQLSTLDWLKYDCKLETRTVTAEFSSRRSLLGALVYLNPDSCEGRTTWINPILAEGQERGTWESALLEFMKTGDVSVEFSHQYWWKFVEEGVSMGKEIKLLLALNKRQV